MPRNKWLIFFPSVFFCASQTNDCTTDFDLPGRIDCVDCQARPKGHEALRPRRRLRRTQRRPIDVSGTHAAPQKKRSTSAQRTDQHSCFFFSISAASLRSTSADNSDSTSCSMSSTLITPRRCSWYKKSADCSAACTRISCRLRSRSEALRPSSTLACSSRRIQHHVQHILNFSNLIEAASASPPL